MDARENFINLDKLVNRLICHLLSAFCHVFKLFCLYERIFPVDSLPKVMKERELLKFAQLQYLWIFLMSEKIHSGNGPFRLVQSTMDENEVVPQTFWITRKIKIKLNIIYEVWSLFPLQLCVIRVLSFMPFCVH